MDKYTDNMYQDISGKWVAELLREGKAIKRFMADTPQEANRLMNEYIFGDQKAEGLLLLCTTGAILVLTIGYGVFCFARWCLGY